MVVYIITAALILFMVTAAFLFYKNRMLRKQIHTIASDLHRIQTSDSDEKVMLFTSENNIVFLIEQINRALEARQKARTDYRKSELKAKRMLSNISHDIKTPLTVILGYLEIMCLDSKYNTIMLKKVENKANQLMELINEFFTLAKVEAGDFDLSLTRVHMNEFCKEIMIDFYELLTEKEILVDIQIPENDLFVYSNPEALKRILLNLISNAIRYGSDGKYLGLCLRYDERKLWVDITDKGAGIEKAEQEHVFDRLYTSDGTRNKHVQGNGLGLTIAKELTEKLNGKLFLDSQPNIRTVFTLELSRMKY
jgi:Signal transduction histidine kinase